MLICRWVSIWSDRIRFSSQEKGKIFYFDSKSGEVVVSCAGDVLRSFQFFLRVGPQTRKPQPYVSLFQKVVTEWFNPYPQLKIYGHLFIIKSCYKFEEGLSYSWFKAGFGRSEDHKNLKANEVCFSYKIRWRGWDWTNKNSFHCLIAMKMVGKYEDWVRIERLRQTWTGLDWCMM